MYRSGFPARVMGHPASSVGSTHVALSSSVRKNTASRGLRQQRDRQGPRARRDLQSLAGTSPLRAWSAGPQLGITWASLEMQSLGHHLGVLSQNLKLNKTHG